MNFDPTTASAEEWHFFFIDLRNLRKDLKDLEDTDATPCSRAFAQVAVLPVNDRVAVLSRIVSALLSVWREIDASLTRTEVARGALHPVLSIREIAVVDGVPDEVLVSILHRLWNELPNDKDIALLMRAYGCLVPLERAELQNYFHFSFPAYAMPVVMVLLERGDIDLASFLFRCRADQFNLGYDPHWLTPYVARGLKIDAAKKWLDASVNATDPYKRPNYDAALERWQDLEAARLAS